MGETMTEERRLYFLQTKTDEDSPWTIHGAELYWQEAIPRVDRLLELRTVYGMHMYEAVRMVDEETLEVVSVSRRDAE